MLFRSEELGKEITKYYENDESELVVVGILRGSTLFFADLIRNINLPILIDFMAISSYGNTSESGVVKIVKDLEADVTGKNILIVEDIRNIYTYLFCGHMYRSSCRNLYMFIIYYNIYHFFIHNICSFTKLCLLH